MVALDPVNMYARYEGTIISPVPPVDGYLAINDTHLEFKGAGLDLNVPLEEIVKTDVVKDELGRPKIRVMYHDNEKSLRSVLFDLVVDPIWAVGQIILFKNHRMQEMINAFPNERPRLTIRRLEVE